MISSKTRTLLRELAVESEHFELLVLFSYFEDHGQDAPTMAEIKEGTNIRSPHTIKAARDTLERTGFITTTHKKGRRIVVEVKNIFQIDIAQSILILYDSYNIRREENKKKEGPGDINLEKSSTGGKGRNWSLEDILEDEDWKKAEAILLKYFPKNKINPVFLTKHHGFSKLIQLMDEVDFDKYCKWYRVNKYPRKKFNYGLFLYPAMVEEFKDEELEGKTDSYLNTSSNLENDDGYRRLVEEQDKVLTAELERINAKKDS